MGFENGDECIILDRRYSHDFEIGERVRILKKYLHTNSETSYDCETMDRNKFYPRYYVLEDSMVLARPKFKLPDELFEVV